jgi:hypothetical protein
MADARALTEEVRGDAETLWSKLLALYQGGAHLALGYGSWGDYFAAEFGRSRRRGYQLLEAGRVLEVVQSLALDAPANDAQARELAPLRADPAALRDAWEEASATGEPTAARVRAAVQERLPETVEDVREFDERTEAICPTCHGTGRVPVREGRLGEQQ